MRLAIIADIHSNFPALEAVMADIAQQDVDEIIVAGDALNAGPCPREVLDTLYARQLPMVLGNHEQYVIDTQLPTEDWTHPPEWGTSHWTAKFLNAEDFAYLRQLPMTLERGDILITHAAPSDIFRGVMPNTPDEELANLFSHVSQRYIVTAHTHLPLVRPWRDKIIINPGSVGMSLDGNYMPSYAILSAVGERVIVQNRRVPYDRAHLSRYAQERALLQEAHPFATAFHRQMHTGENYITPLIAHVNELTGQGLSLLEALKAVDVAQIAPKRDYQFL